MHLNFGELGASIKSLVDNYQAKAKMNEKIESIEDMKNFVQNYPQVRNGVVVAVWLTFLLFYTLVKCISSMKELVVRAIDG